MLNLLFQSLMANAQEAATATPAQPGWAMQILPIAVMFFVFYFLIIRPQSKKTKLHQEFLNSLKIGEMVLTNSGIVGKIREMTNQFIDLEVSDGVRIRMLRSMISGPLKTEEKK